MKEWWTFQFGRGIGKDISFWKLWKKQRTHRQAESATGDARSREKGEKKFMSIGGQNASWYWGNDGT